MIDEKRLEELKEDIDGFMKLVADPSGFEQKFSMVEAQQLIRLARLGLKCLEQDRIRGYPTGVEWHNLIAALPKEEK